MSGKLTIGAWIGAGLLYILLLWAAGLLAIIVSFGELSEAAFWLLGFASGLVVALLARQVTASFALSAAFPLISIGWAALATLFTLAISVFLPNGPILKTLVMEGAMGIAMPVGMALGFCLPRPRWLDRSAPSDDYPSSQPRDRY